MRSTPESPNGDDEFWRDDAAAIVERERERSTGLRMPKASSPVASGSASGSALPGSGISYRQLAFALSECDTRSDASFDLWQEYEDDPEHFFKQMSPAFQRSFCGGLLSRFSTVNAGPALTVSSSQAPLASAGSCANCGGHVSALAILCPLCGKPTRNAGAQLPLLPVVVSLLVAGVVWFVIDVLMVGSR